MKQTKLLTRACVLVLVLFCLWVCIASLAPVHGASHECRGERCALCLVVSSCEKLLRLVALLLCGFGAAVPLVASARAFSRARCEVAPFVTPIDLRVKLLN